MKIIRDFKERSEQEQKWFLQDTWCSKCQLPDLGMVEPSEYEEDGHMFIGGRCTKCGSSVVSEIIEK